MFSIKSIENQEKNLTLMRRFSGGFKYQILNKYDNNKRTDPDPTDNYAFDKLCKYKKIYKFC